MTNSTSTLAGQPDGKAGGQPKKYFFAPIPFQRAEPRKLRKEQRLEFKLWNDPTDMNSAEFTKYVPIFDGGSPEELLWLLRDIKHVIHGQSLVQEPQKFELGRRLFQGDALAVFNVASAKVNENDEGSFDMAINELKAHVFPKRALAE